MQVASARVRRAAETGGRGGRPIPASRGRTRGIMLMTITDLFMPSTIGNWIVTILSHIYDNENRRIFFGTHIIWQGMIA